MTRRAATAWLAVGTGLFVGLVSLGRILIANHGALSSLVWAEDGLFPLCAKAHGALPCAVEPYAGYLLLVPRLVAWPVSLASLDSLPLTSNLAAALLAATLAGVTVCVLRAAGIGTTATLVVAALPVLIPLMSFEAINATASSYMVLPFVAALAICFPPTGRYPTALYAALLLVSQLTNPLTALLAIILLVHAIRDRIPRRSAWVLGVTLAAGLLTQALAARLSATPRLVEWSAESAHNWASSLPAALLTFWPGATELSTNGSLQSSATGSWGAAAGTVLAAAVLAGGVALLVSRSSAANGIGMLLVFGLLMGILPAAAGHANNRYYITAALVWTAAGLVALDRFAPGPRGVVVVLASVALVALCVPALPASDYRAVPAPPWSRMLDAARMTCYGEPRGSVPLSFSPSWPFPDVVYTGRTSNIVACPLVVDGTLP